MQRRLGKTVDVGYLERDLGGECMLKVEVDGRCVLYKQSVRDSDSQTIPHFV